MSFSLIASLAYFLEEKERIDRFLEHIIEKI